MFENLNGEFQNEKNLFFTKKIVLKPLQFFRKLRDVSVHTKMALVRLSNAI